ncbi:MAG TPA: SdiA-regulated domain-containing protein [Flavobacteriales bacterium]|nr:SdiA-regulated domain-containing protein [Flavobacteriales bacterium]
MRTILSLALFVAAPAMRPGELPKPTATYDLPAQLTEVSGLTELDAHSVACLQDEEAVLYIVDLHSGRIRERFPFGPPGDMEGLTRVGDTFFALRSDGLIYTLQRQAGRYVASDSFRVEIGHDNIEGLAFDERMDRVLIAPKDVPKGEKALRDQREVFAFDRATRTLLPQPVLSFSVEEVVRQAAAKGIALPTRTTPKGREVSALKLRLASVAVDPISDHYFLLSAVDRTLLVLDRNGAFVDLFLLNAALLPKPEGITFLPNGDLIITSEGKGTPPRLVRYPAFK